MDVAHAYCLGCKRHINEIVQWLSYTEAERQEIMAALTHRNVGPEDL